MEDPTQNLTDKQLKYSYWYLLHKKEIKKIGLILFIALDTILVLWALFGLVKFLNNYSELNELTTTPEYIDWQAYHEENQPKELIISTTKAVKTTNGKTDIGVEISNVNTEWGVRKLVYQFVLPGGQVTPEQETFLLPNESKYLLALDVNSIGTTASLQIITRDWARVRPDDNIYSMVNISNETFTPASRIEGQDLGGQASWTVDNNSSYSFYDPGFIVVLYSGTREVAFNYMKLSFLDSLTSRELTVSWGHSLPNVTAIKVMPDINLFDPGIIK
ncbi:MAG: hypothetical protein ACKKL6_02645 [Candidatus Komeilibacteria bacterium]